MSLPYEGATSGERALSQTQKLLERFGCQSFGSMVDYERKVIIVQFKYRGMQVHLEASITGYANMWLKEHPYSGRTKKPRVDHERQAFEIASRAVYSIVRDWIKGQITAVETGMIPFEGAFLGQIMLASGMTALQHMQQSTGLLPSGDSK